MSASVLGSFDFRQIAISSIGFVILAIGIAICLKPKLLKTEADTVPVYPFVQDAADVGLVESPPVAEAGPSGSRKRARPAAPVDVERTTLDVDLMN